ncbi:hypothetical protein HNP84_009073 [Thermocatellispora tengchongensis]|uniref:Uncharacterized protein n=1 Tax=Thermocatellispora tengchongensis TaxID=1073253 RepID=A0A840PNN1_9ACTN|nr:hypothetical protein [Thermocatellispora tengchongensis]
MAVRPAAKSGRTSITDAGWAAYRRGGISSWHAGRRARPDHHGHGGIGVHDRRDAAPARPRPTDTRPVGHAAPAPLRPTGAGLGEPPGEHPRLGRGRPSWNSPRIVQPSPLSDRLRAGRRSAPARPAGPSAPRTPRSSRAGKIRRAARRPEVTRPRVRRRARGIRGRGHGVKGRRRGSVARSRARQRRRRSGTAIAGQQRGRGPAIAGQAPPSPPRHPHPRPGTTHPRPGTTHPRSGTTHPRPGTTHPRPGTTHPRSGTAIAGQAARSRAAARRAKA